MSKIEYIGNGLAMLGEHGIIVNMGADELIVAPKSPKPERPNEGGSSNVAFWGEDNDFPQQVIERVEKDTELPPLLDWKGRALQGREVVAVDLVWNKEKKDFDVVRINDPEINNFIAARTFKRYWREACVDFSWFGMPFPDLIKNAGMDKIAYLGTHDASWCRWSKQNPKGNITVCYVASNWPDAKESDPTTMKFPVVDPYDPLAAEKLKEDKRIRRCVFPINYPSPGKAYYPSTPYHSFLFSKWYDIKQLIPEMKASLMQKILSAKWILHIPVNYWPSIYPTWHQMTPDERLEKKKLKVAEIEKTLTGTANAGKTVLFEVGVDDHGNIIPGWKLEPIMDALKDGQHLEDSNEASMHGMRGLGTDPALVGDGPGKTNNGSSSSDKRIAFNIFVAQLTPYREVLFEPLYFIAEFNGWLNRYPNLRFKVLEIELETLDKAHATSKETNPVTTNPAKEGAGK
ncbi:hypothetical protein ACFSJU_14790 [Paradesertivirga mongoliensis]|uniref:Uncharacterized protein n=1 Tax=Paradesertivirga mongoliensis TaxID=2100740 RepID=A0ABW4ZQ12_9SPHI|nr:hypothetical protein [Pedobacter mongoliensis]